MQEFGSFQCTQLPFRVDVKCYGEQPTTSWTVDLDVQCVYNSVHQLTC